MGKVAKARKSTHATKKATAKTRGKIIEDPNAEWDVESVGPCYLLFGKKKVRSAKGKTVKKYYIRKNEKHLIWVKWVQPFSDKKACVWSAEPQELLRNSGLKKQVDECLDKKVIWPFPSNADGADSGYSERIALCKEAGYSLWKATNRDEKNAAWTLLNGVEPSTASSDASTSETSETEQSTVEEEEEEDEV